MGGKKKEKGKREKKYEKGRKKVNLHMEWGKRREREHTQMCQKVTKLMNLYFMIPFIRNIQNWQI